MFLGNDGGNTGLVALNATQARYEKVRDMRAAFVQTSYTAALDESTVLKGRVIVQRPGKMRWAYDAPDGRVIVLDGETIRLYDPEEKQLQIAALVEGTVSPTALSFLLGEGELREIFAAERIEDAGRKEIGLRLTPLRDGSFESLVLWLDPNTHQMRESVVVDLIGNRTTLVFEGMVENGGAKPDEFDLAVPTGTEVIDLRPVR